MIKTIANDLNLTLVGELPVKGIVRYDADSKIFTFEDGSKAKQYNGLSIVSEVYEKYWKEVK